MLDCLEVIKVRQVGQGTLSRCFGPISHVAAADMYSWQRWAFLQSQFFWGRLLPDPQSQSCSPPMLHR